jgi:hypothetical protein
VRQTAAFADAEVIWGGARKTVAPLARPPEFAVCPLMREIQAFRYFWPICWPRFCARLRPSAVRVADKGHAPRRPARRERQSSIARRWCRCRPTAPRVIGLERLCVQARYQARGEVQRRLTEGLTADQRRRLDALTQRRAETNQSWLAWLAPDAGSGEAGRDARSDRASGPCPRRRP